MELCREVRPGGKKYNARKPPQALVFQNGWPEDDCILVVRVSREDEAEARKLAEAEMPAHDYTLMARGRFGWWRETVRNSEPYWEYDDVNGMPGWVYNVE